MAKISIREFMNRHSVLVVIVSVVVMFLAVMYAFNGTGGGTARPPTELYFYDTMTGELFVASAKEYPPINTPSQAAGSKPAGVRANVFSCGKCNEKEWYIGYLETYTPEAKEVQLKLDEEMSRPVPPAAGDAGPVPPIGPSLEDSKRLIDGHLVASPKAVDKWLKQESNEGASLASGAVKKCPDNKYPQQCFPGR